MKALLLVLSLLLLPIAAVASDVEQIIERANQAAYYAGKDGRTDVQMTIFDRNGGTRQREFSILRLNGTNGNQKFYVYFRMPADVRKMAFLVWKKISENDDRWLWLPALNLKKRIAPGDKRTSFVGSDFLYEDVSGRGTNEDFHELVAEDEQSWTIKNSPKNPESVEFSYYRVRIDKLSYLPLEAEYYDKAEKLYRRVSATKIETIDGYPTVIEALAEDLNAGTKTVNSFSQVKYDIGLKDRIFTERFLRRPPREIRK